MKWKFLWIDEDHDVQGTNDEILAGKIAKFEPVINVETGQFMLFWQESPEERLVDIPSVMYPDNWDE